MIMPGVNIGNGAVIGSRSVITKDVALILLSLLITTLLNSAFTPEQVEMRTEMVMAGLVRATTETSHAIDVQW